MKGILQFVAAGRRDQYLTALFILWRPRTVSPATAKRQFCRFCLDAKYSAKRRQLDPYHDQPTTHFHHVKNNAGNENVGCQCQVNELSFAHFMIHRSEQSLQ
jgi:hypothetical protein